MHFIHSCMVKLAAGRITQVRHILQDVSYANHAYIHSFREAGWDAELLRTLLASLPIEYINES